VQALSRLPAFSKLEVRHLSPAALPLLASLSALVELQMTMQGSRPDHLFSAAAAVPHLAACKLLTSLTLFHCSFDTTDLRTLTSGMLELQALHFVGCELPSLDPLSEAQRLRTLSLLGASSLGLAALLPLAACKSLRDLYVSITQKDRAVARFMLSHADFQHVTHFDICDV